MPMHMAAWSASVDQAALAALPAIADPILRIQGNDIIVPPLGHLGFVYPIGVNLTLAQLVSPSLRRMWPFDVAPLQRAAAVAVPTPWHDWYNRPLTLTPGEAIDALTAEDGAGATRMSVIVQFIDGPVNPASGEIFTIKCTGATTLVAFTWTNVALTLSQALPVGTYQLVGMRVESAGAIAARAVFISGTWRPGCIGYTTAQLAQNDPHRYGRLGVWGQFDNLTPPSVDVFSASADTAETIWLDLIKIG